MISVIIPTYNREKTIKYSINSVLKQTYQNFEIIIVDDASTDRTLNILQEYKDKRIKIIKLKENSGACFARNIGIENAKGKYIAFHDSDDEMLPSRLEIGIKTIEKENVDVIFSKFIRKYKNKRIDILPNYNLNEITDKIEALLYDNAISTPTILGKVAVFNNIHFDISFPRFQDWEIGLRIVENYKIYYIDEVLLIAHVQADSITQNYGKSIVALNKMHKKYQNYFLNNKYLEEKYFKLLGEFKSRAGINATKEFKQAFMLEKNKNTYIKYFLSKIHIFNFLIKIRIKLLKGI